MTGSEPKEEKKKKYLNPNSPPSLARLQTLNHPPTKQKPKH